MKGIKQINNFLLLKVIGQGASATVYQGLNITTSTLVAIKSISTLKLEKGTSFQSFQKEINLIKDLNHPNIIQVLGKEKTSNNLYIILEFANGGNLFDYLSNTIKTTSSPLSEVHVQKIIRQLISGLEYLHQKNIIHRDIKLENILLNFSEHSNKLEKGKDSTTITIDQTSLDHPFTIKIADFGFARELQNGCVAQTVCGTPITMAPDIFTNHQYNSRVDLWSLGAITYELIVGRPPFYSTNSKQLFQEINKGKYSFPHQLKTSIEAISFINKLLQFNPDNRMSWDDIKMHPFIINDVKTFHSIELCHQNTQTNSIEELELNVKNCDNYLWLTYKDKNQLGISLDKINDKIEIDNEYIPSLNNNNPNKEVKENKTIIKNMSVNQQGGEGEEKEDKWEIISPSTSTQSNINDFIVSDYPNCHLRDYVNFLCNRCKKNLCKEHYHHELSCPFVPVDEDNEKKANKSLVEFHYKVTKCSFCNDEIKNIKPFECKICKGLFCSSHRIESNHNCTKVEKVSVKGKYEEAKEKMRLKMMEAKKKK